MIKPFSDTHHSTYTLYRQKYRPISREMTNPNNKLEQKDLKHVFINNYKIINYNGAFYVKS